MPTTSSRGIDNVQSGHPTRQARRTWAFVRVGKIVIAGSQFGHPFIFPAKFVPDGQIVLISGVNHPDEIYESDWMVDKAMQEKHTSNADGTGEITRPKRQFVSEFEGLRGLLAAWVVFGHILLFSGFTYQEGWFGIVASPVLGVYTFMMLSGFVITAALDQRPTTWLEFMKRRFFRLFPVYAFCLALAILLFDVSLSISRSVTLATFGPENLERLTDVQENFGTYFIADATLLQCLMPRPWFPFAHESFLPPT